jgi:uncharacterized protein (DUF58 family)
VHEDSGELAALLAEVRRIEVQSRHLVAGVMAGGYLSAFRGGGIEFDAVREYGEGDDPRTIDWNVTARLGRPFVKTYVEERERTVLFLLDLSPSMSGGFGAWSTRQAAARVCACLAFSAVAGGDRVGLVGFADGIVRRVEPEKGRAHALRIVRDCLALPAQGTRSDLAAALDHVSRAFRRRAVVFVLSDFLADGWREAAARSARRHDVVAVRFSRAESLAPPRGDRMRVVEPETGRVRVVDWGHAPTREDFLRRAAARRERTEQDLRRAGVDRLDVPVPFAPGPDAIAGPIVRFFRMREARGAVR